MVIEMSKASERQRRFEEAAKRREKIMGSKPFKEWWAARQHIHPMPSDPFRAFMIDVGLHAKIHTKEIWRGRTPRADFPSIDLPSGIPAPKRRIPSRKEERRFKLIPRAAEPYGEPTEFEKGLQRQVDKMSEHYHVAAPRLVFERGEGILSSSYYHGAFGDIMPFIKLGVKGGKRSEAQALGALGHEFGHHVHAKRGLPDISSGLTVEFKRAGRVEKERTAWQLADPFMSKDRRIQKYLKKYAFGTYLGTSPREGQGSIQTPSQFEADLFKGELRRLR